MAIADEPVQPGVEGVQRSSFKVVLLKQIKAEWLSRRKEEVPTRFRSLSGANSITTSSLSVEEALCSGVLPASS